MATSTQDFKKFSSFCSLTIGTYRMTRLGKTTVSPVSPEAIKNNFNRTYLPNFKVHQGRRKLKSFGWDKSIWWAHRIDYFPWPWSIHSQSCPIFIERSDKHQQILCDVISERMNNDCWVSNSSLLKFKVITSQVL